MSLDKITNFVTLSDRVGTAGQPTVQQYESVRDAGYEVVINLATPDSKNAIPNESEVVTSHGLSYFQIPVVWLEPTKDDFRLFTDLMDALEDRKVFVHCVVTSSARKRKVYNVRYTRSDTGPAQHDSGWLADRSSQVPLIPG